MAHSIGDVVMGSWVVIATPPTEYSNDAKRYLVRNPATGEIQDWIDTAPASSYVPPPGPNSGGSASALTTITWGAHPASADGLISIIGTDILPADQTFVLSRGKVLVIEGLIGCDGGVSDEFGVYVQYDSYPHKYGVSMHSGQLVDNDGVSQNVRGTFGTLHDAMLHHFRWIIEISQTRTDHNVNVDGFGGCSYTDTLGIFPTMAGTTAKIIPYAGTATDHVQYVALKAGVVTASW